MIVKMKKTPYSIKALARYALFSTDSNFKKKKPNQNYFIINQDSFQANEVIIRKRILPKES